MPSEQILERQADEEIPAVVASRALNRVEIPDLEAGDHDGDLEATTKGNSNSRVAIRGTQNLRDVEHEERFH